MKKSRRLLLTVSMLFCVSFSSISLAAVNSVVKQCDDAVKQDKSWREILENCLWSERGRGLAALSGNTLQHGFGIRTRPNKTGQFVIDKANNNEAKYQLLHAYMVNYFYSSPDPEHYEQSQQLILASAEQGFLPAQSIYLSGLLFSNTLPSDSAKKRAIRYGKNLLTNGFPQASALLFKAKKLVSDNEFNQQFQTFLGRYKTLSVAKTERMLDEFERVYFRNLETSLAVNFSQHKLDIYQYLLDEHDNSNAGLKLIYHYKNINEHAMLNVIKQLADIRDPKGMAILGEYYACRNDKLNGMIWLERAATNGDSEANDLLEELKEYGSIYSCNW